MRDPRRALEHGTASSGVDKPIRAARAAVESPGERVGGSVAAIDKADEVAQLHAPPVLSLAAVLYEAIVGVAQERGWEIAGGVLAPTP